LTSSDFLELPSRRIFLIGAMGAGKSTIGNRLSELLGWPYIDNDYEMSKMAHMSMKELAALDVPTLHKLEHDYLVDVLGRPAPLIAGAAASVGDDLPLLEALKDQFTIYLHVPLEKLKSRAGSSGVGRQAFSENPMEIIRERYERRDPRYRAVACLIIDPSDPVADAKTIIDALPRH
jgi:shikimate kinase